MNCENHLVKGECSETCTLLTPDPFWTERLSVSRLLLLKAEFLQPRPSWQMCLQIHQPHRKDGPCGGCWNTNCRWGGSFTSLLWLANVHCECPSPNAQQGQGAFRGLCISWVLPQKLRQGGSINGGEEEDWVSFHFQCLASLIQPRPCSWKYLFPWIVPSLFCPHTMKKSKVFPVSTETSSVIRNEISVRWYFPSDYVLY